MVGSAKAPRFDESKPEELERYFEHLEDLFTLHGIDATKHKERKRLAGKYAPASVEREWVAMTTYESPHTYEKYKEEIISSYPSAANLKKGSVGSLKKLCHDNPRLGRSNETEIKAFRRKFNSEIKKLSATATQNAVNGVVNTLISNRETVDMVLSCFEPGFREQVIQRLDTISAVAASNRSGEDPYLLEEVWKAAEHLAAGVGSSFSNVVTRVNAPPISDKGNLKLEEDMTEVKQTLVANTDWQKTFARKQDQDVTRLEKMMQQLIAQNSRGGNSSNNNNNTNNVQRNYGNPAPAHNNPEVICYHCNEPNHIAANCPIRQKQFEAGKIKFGTNGRVKMMDGSEIPSELGLSVANRVDKYASKDKSQNFIRVAQEDEDYYRNQYLMSMISPQGADASAFNNMGPIPVNQFIQQSAPMSAQASTPETDLDSLPASDQQSFLEFSKTMLPMYMAAKKDF